MARRLSRAYPGTMKSMVHPKQKHAVLRYYETFELAAGTANTFSEYLFNANSIYDPDQTGTGHQPLGHDQWATFFGAYLVIGSKCSAWVRAVDNVATDGIAAIRSGLICSDRSYSGVSDQTAIESGLVRTKVWYPQGNAAGVYTGAMQTTKPTFTAYYSPRKYWEISNTRDLHATIGAAFGANPTSLAEFRYLFCDYSTPGVSVGHYVTIQIDYLIELRDPILLSTS